MKIRSFNLVFYIFFIFPVFTNAETWGNVEDWLTWNDANTKCQSLGMRLPTINELKRAFKAGKTKSWDATPGAYWSSTPARGGNHFSLNIADNGFVGSASGNFGVKCFKP